MTDDQQPEQPSFVVEPADVVLLLRQTHPDLVSAAEWKVAALRTLDERNLAQDRIALLEAALTNEAAPDTNDSNK